MASSSVVGGGAKSASRPRAAHVCGRGVEYDSASGSSRPPVLCDPSTRQHLVVGVLTLETITVDVERKNNRGQADGRTDRQTAGGRNGGGQSVDVEKQEWTERRAVVGG